MQKYIQGNWEQNYSLKSITTYSHNCKIARRISDRGISDYSTTANQEIGCKQGLNKAFKSHREVEVCVWKSDMNVNYLNRSSEEEHMENALALGAEEGRDKLR